MVEHLSFTLRMSTGREPQMLHSPEEKLEGLRRFLFSDKPMPVGARVPFMGEEPPQLVHPDLNTAKKEFMQEIQNFFSYYSGHPSKTEMHPVFGLLDRQGWVALHNKHFTHHFRQFELI
jgi:hypothetical protein